MFKKKKKKNKMENHPSEIMTHKLAKVACVTWYVGDVFCSRLIFKKKFL